MISTKATYINGGYNCRVFIDDHPVVEARVKHREDIGPAFRDLLRTLDTCGGDEFTSASRKRKFKEGNKQLEVKHRWYER